MLYNPDWKTPKTKPDPFQLSTLIGWLQQQPADKTYAYIRSDSCLLAQYFRAKGYKSITVGSYAMQYSRWFTLGVPVCRRKLPKHFNAVAIGYGCGCWTFGNALKFAREIQLEELTAACKPVTQDQSLGALLPASL